MQQRADDARQQAGSVTVPARLVHPHPVVAMWLGDRERQRELARFEPNPTLRRLRAPEWTDIERRRHRILDALFKAAEKKGIRVKQEERKGVWFETSGEPLEFRLKEKQKQVRIPKSAEEMKRLRPGERSWRQELQPSGILVFSIETYLPTLPQRVWADAPDRPLEDQLGDILAQIILAGPLLVQQRREREGAERKRMAEERRRYEEAERSRLDDNRWRRFTELAGNWTQAEQARQFLAALEQHAGPDALLANGTRLAQWLTWAQERIKMLDPLLAGPTAVFEDVLTVTSWTYPRH